MSSGQAQTDETATRGEPGDNSQSAGCTSLGQAVSATTPPDVGQLLVQAQKSLAKAPFQPPRREANLLLARVLELSEAQILAREERPVSAAAAQRFHDLLQRRLAGEPVAYLLGEREFYGRCFAVDRRVLIPRPETEHLIEAALGLDLQGQPHILDVGTGSGNIALTLGLEIAGSRITATDRSLGALAVYAHNRRRLGLEDRAPALCTNLAAGLDLRAFDLLVSNPPYIDPAVKPELSPEVCRFEPAQALFAEEEGRETLRHLLHTCRQLRPGAWALLEIGYDQGDWLRGVVADLAELELIEILPDYAGHDRNALLRRPNH